MSALKYVILLPCSIHELQRSAALIPAYFGSSRRLRIYALRVVEGKSTPPFDIQACSDFKSTPDDNAMMEKDKR